MSIWKEKSLLDWGERIFFVSVIIIIVFPIRTIFYLSLSYVVFLKIISFFVILLLFRTYNLKILSIFSISKAFYSEYDTFQIFSKFNEFLGRSLIKNKSALPKIEPEDKEGLTNPTIEVFYKGKDGESVLSAWQGEKHKTEGYFVFPKKDKEAENAFSEMIASNFLIHK